jgi:RNA polymerase sigma-70 factor, ECF subfamily
MATPVCGGKLLVTRCNETWITVLSCPGPERDRAVIELRQAVLRGLHGTVDPSGRLTEADLDDFAQEGVMAVLRALPTFRGEARFLTWALKVAVRAALTELRRHHWRDISLEQPSPVGEDVPMPEMLDPSAPDPEQRAVQRMIEERLYRSIARDLTERQRQALMAVHFQGMPLAEVARRMGTNRNAMYKLLHDARRRLRASLLQGGLSEGDILDAFSD